MSKPNLPPMPNDLWLSLSAKQEECVYAYAEEAVRQALAEQVPTSADGEDAKRWRWMWNHAENVGFSYRVDQYTRSNVSGLHCGTLKDAVDSARAALSKPETRDG